MKKIVFCSLAALTLSAVSCGLDPDLIASGKENSCKVKEITKQLEADPGNPELQTELERYSSYLEINIENAGEGNKAAMQEAIKEASKDCD